MTFIIIIIIIIFIILNYYNYMSLLMFCLLSLLQIIAYLVMCLLSCLASLVMAAFIFYWTWYWGVYCSSQSKKCSHVTVRSCPGPASLWDRQDRSRGPSEKLSDLMAHDSGAVTRGTGAYHPSRGGKEARKERKGREKEKGKDENEDAWNISCNSAPSPNVL